MRDQFPVNLQDSYMTRTTRVALAAGSIPNIQPADGRRVAISVAIEPQAGVVATDMVTIGYLKGATINGILTVGGNTPYARVTVNDIGSAIKESIDYLAVFTTNLTVSVTELLYIGGTDNANLNESTA